MPTWKIYVAESDSLERVADITHEARGKQLDVAINKGGSFSCNLPMSSDAYPYLNPVKNCVVAVKNGVTVYSGPIWTRRDNLSQGNIQLGSVGWLELLNKRYTMQEIEYNAYNAGLIAHELLDVANDQEDTWISRGVNTDVQVRTLTYNRFQNIGQEISRLSDMEAGFNYSVDPITREMNILGHDDYDDRQNVVFGFNWGPHNISEFEVSADADAMQNEVIVATERKAIVARDDASILENNLFQFIISINDTVGDDVLEAIANAELAVNKDPRILISFTPSPEGVNSPNVPKFFEDYGIGDQVYVSAKRFNYELYDQPVRVFGASIQIDELGNERLSQVQTTYQGGG